MTSLLLRVTCTLVLPEIKTPNVDINSMYLYFFVIIVGKIRSST